MALDFHRASTLRFALSYVADGHGGTGSIVLLDSLDSLWEERQGKGWSLPVATWKFFGENSGKAVRNPKHMERNECHKWSCPPFSNIDPWWLPSFHSYIKLSYIENPEDTKNVSWLGYKDDYCLLSTKGNLWKGAAGKQIICRGQCLDKGVPES